MSDLILFWHRRDLRISDNVGLAAARDRSPRVVGVFCLDPNILNRNDVAPVRVTYMIACLRSLQQRYADVGSQLLLLYTDPVQGIPALARALKVQAVFWNLDVEPYSQQRDRAVTEALQRQNITVSTVWDQLLHSPEQIHTAEGKPYTVFTPFWHNWSRHPKSAPVASLHNVTGLTEAEVTAAREAGVITLPSVQELGFVWQHPLVVQPGEQAAQDLLDRFCDGVMTHYHDQRNFPAQAGTSQLSAPLKFGVIGIRSVWAATEITEAACRSDQAIKSIQTWRQELAWREFYQHALFAFPELAQQSYRPVLQNFPWHNHHAHFQAWCQGRTGYPIVDAAMRQLNQTGWMHNRCRMIVASFLTKDLIINWQWGEKYFMQSLIDGDLSANNGGWQWSASSGLDPKPLRIFNPVSQTQKFDPKAKYIRQWLPELGPVDTQHLVRGQVPPEDLDRCGYPAPIVDHNHQQRLFKQLYQAQRAALGGKS